MRKKTDSIILKKIPPDRIRGNLNFILFCKDYFFFFTIAALARTAAAAAAPAAAGIFAVSPVFGDSVLPLDAVVDFAVVVVAFVVALVVAFVVVLDAASVEDAASDSLR